MVSPFTTYTKQPNRTKLLLWFGVVGVAMCVILITVSLLLANRANNTSDSAVSQASAAAILAHTLDDNNRVVFCPIWRQGVDAASAITPTQLVTDSALKLYATFWNAYDVQRCAPDYGPLPKPPPQLAPQLPARLR